MNWTTETPKPKTVRKSGLSNLQLILMGKGPIQKIKPPNCTAWQGDAGGSRPPFDVEQSKLNRELGYW